MPFIGGGGHIWLVMILLLVFVIIKGPGKLPEMGAGIGRAIREFRHATDTSASSHAEAPQAATPPIAAPVAALPPPPAAVVPVVAAPVAAAAPAEAAPVAGSNHH